MNKLPFPLLIFFVLFSSCIGFNHKNPVLDELDTMVQEQPDSAYTILSSFDRSTLTTKEEVAHFSLLYSIALDKMYIDVTEDTLINVAVDFYKHKNNRYAFLSHYYHGRVFENANRKEDAMQAFILAETVPEKKVDPLYLAKLHFGKERIYNFLFLNRKALEEAELAAKYSLEAKHWNNYARALMDQSSFYLMLDDTLDGSNPSNYEKADSCLAAVKRMWDKTKPSIHSEWLFSSIKVLRITESIDSLQKLMHNYMYLSDINPATTEWSTIAQAYQALDMIPEMQEALDRGRSYGHQNGREGPSYCLLQEAASVRSGDYKGAYESLKEYTRLSNVMDWDIYHQDTKFLEERFQNELNQSKAHSRLLASLLILLFSLVVISILVFVIQRHLKKAAITETALNDLREEYEMLKSIKAENDEISEKALGVLKERMLTLKDFLEKKNRAANELDRLSGNRTSILESIGMIYAIYAPKFTEVLIDKGLSPAEIGYCCLHLMGYSTKEAGDFICHSAYYNISSKIRAKLQIESNRSTLAKWLTQKYSETCGK
ncbi:MAG: hypothetical protein MJY97_06640 [Bacteroidales bacterium]|nr:hypothetical protein [Bacteroidales bacterium]